MNRTVFHLSHLILSVWLTLLFLSGCSESDNKDNIDGRHADFKVAKEVRLPLDSLSQPMMSYFQLLREDTLKFLFYNEFNKSIYVYDFRNSRLLRRIELRYDYGELPPIQAFYYLSQDSILLFPAHGDFFLVSNEQGSVYPDKTKFVDKDDQNKIESHWISSSAPLMKLKDHIYINNVFGWIAKEGDPDKFLLIKYDLNKSTSEFIIQHPPSINNTNFENSTFRHMKATVKEPDQTILYSFGFDPYVYEYDVKTGNVTDYYCAPPADYVKPEKLKKELPSDAIWTHFQTNFSFSDIRFDPYRNVVIRLGLLPYDLDDIQSGLINPEDPKKPKIYLFDGRSYKFIDEFMLDKNQTYYFINQFVTEEGLWIQKILDDEDTMCFELIAYEIK